MTEISSNNWNSFPDHSQVWVYQSSRPLSAEETAQLQTETADFLDVWNSHGAALVAGYKVMYDRFLAVIVDPENSPSGCSKDSMVHFVQKVGKSLNVDFFDRLQVLYRDSQGAINSCKLAELETLAKSGKIDGKTVVFNNLASTKAEFDQNWETTIENSWHKQFLN